MTDYRNWKTAISTSHTDYETLKRFTDCGVQAMELSVSWDECDSIDWAALRYNADAADIEILSYHLPFSGELNIAATDEAERQRVVTYQCGMIKKAADIGIRRFVIHPSAEPLPDDALANNPRWLAAWNMSEEEIAGYKAQLEGISRADCMAAAKKSLAELADYAAQFDAVICVEDLPRTCLGHTVEEMQELVSADERLRVCFDVNHFLTDYGSTHKQFVEKLGHLIVTTHMSDYDFIDEKHFFPGYGMLDWKSIVEYLEAADYNGPFLYEGGFSRSSKYPEVPFATFEMARERHMTIKELTGKDHIG